ncbi:MAG: hypothetical protein QM770_03985 [Tepidisphaeraceae bacterium]
MNRLLLATGVVALGLLTTALPAEDIAAKLRGDAPATPTSRPTVPAALGEAFSSEVAGISVRPPAGGDMTRAEGVLRDEVVRYVNLEEQWSFIVSRFVLNDPMPMFIEPQKTPAGADPTAKKQVKADTSVGFAQAAAAQMPNETPGTLLRFELVPLAGNDGALIASRFKDSQGRPRVQQQAIIRKNDRIYYVLTFTTPCSDGPVEDDKMVRQAADRFGEIVGTAKLLDQEQIKSDQTDRLIRTRALMVNWTEQKVKALLVPQTWTRTLRDGKDVGYSYIVEEPADELPRAGVIPKPKRADPTGIRVGIRSRLVQPTGETIDTENWYWLGNDKRQESFSAQTVVTDKAGKAGAFAVERGSMTRTAKPQVDAETDKSGKFASIKDDYKLQVWTLSRKVALPPLSRDLPPFYLPQALQHLLPRLLPVGEPRTYLFALYVGSERNLMMEYVDVLPAQQVDLNGKSVLAVRIRTRLGLEGPATTHFVSVDGQWLGTSDERLKTTTLPADEATLQKIWKNANLTRPGDVSDEGPK